MALNFNEIKKTIIDSIKESIGDQLSQTTNPASGETYGMVFNARPNPPLAVPEYSYAVLDLTNIEDVDWYLTNLKYNEETEQYQYETHKQLTFQISVFGEGALSISNQLATSYRRDDIISIMSNGGLGIADVQQVTIMPELLQTDWLEVGILQLTIRASDIYSDESIESIQAVILSGVLDCANTGELEVNASYNPLS